LYAWQLPKVFPAWGLSSTVVVVLSAQPMDAGVMVVLDPHQQQISIRWLTAWFAWIGMLMKLPISCEASATTPPNFVLPQRQRRH
jgi:hypothetical protein